MKIASPSTIQFRASQLLKQLPEGPSTERRRAPHEAVDALVREYPQSCRADLGRLSRKMAARARFDSVAEEACRLGLQYAADGASGVGSSLAVKILPQAPVSGQREMRKAGFKFLHQCQYLETVMQFESVATPFPLARWLGGSQRADTSRQTLLEQASLGLSQDAAARALLGELGKAGYGSDRVSRNLVATASEKANGEERLTYHLAAATMRHSLMDYNSSDTQVATSFFQDLPHTPQGRAQRLLKVPDPGLRQLQAGVKELKQELKSRGDESWKFLALGHSVQICMPTQSRGEIARLAMHAALQRVGAEPQTLGPQALSGYLAEISKFRETATDGNCGIEITGANTFPATNERLLAMLEGSWQRAYSLLGKVASESIHRHGHRSWEWAAPEILGNLANLGKNQSPLRTVCLGLTRMVSTAFHGGGYDQNCLARTLAEAISLTQERVKSLSSARPARFSRQRVLTRPSGIWPTMCSFGSVRPMPGLRSRGLNLSIRSNVRSQHK